MQSDRLLGLLGCTLLLSANVLADVSCVSGLADNVLEGAPALADRWGNALVGELGVKTGSQLGDGTLDKGALGEAGAEEDGVDRDEDPGALLEEESRTEDSEPQSNLEDGNQSHAAIIVVLDELANHVRGSRSLGLGTGCGCSRRRLDGGEQVRARIGSDVEH